MGARHARRAHDDRGDKGTVFIGTRAIGQVYAVTDNDGTREHKVVAEGQPQPNGHRVQGRRALCHRDRQGAALRRHRGQARQPAAHRRSQTFEMPPATHHGWKFPAFGPDNKLYFTSARRATSASPSPASMRRSGATMPTAAAGGRRARRTQLGRLRFPPADEELWFTDNGRDWAGDDGPEEELNRVAATSRRASSASPIAMPRAWPIPTSRSPMRATASLKPAASLGPHAAALGMRFYTGAMFPAEYRIAPSSPGAVRGTAARNWL